MLKQVDKNIQNFQLKSCLSVSLFYSNWGTESEDIQYHNGNSDPRGFGKFFMVYRY